MRQYIRVHDSNVFFRYIPRSCHNAGPIMRLFCPVKCHRQETGDSWGSVALVPVPSTTLLIPAAFPILSIPSRGLNYTTKNRYPTKNPFCRTREANSTTKPYMASRLIAQLLVVGGSYLARAFFQAYHQALANSGGGSARQAANAAKRVLRGKMEATEAKQVLGLERSSDLGLKQVLGKYDHLFNMNDPKKGGSLYLQAKVYEARKALEEEAAARGERIEEIGGEKGNNTKQKQ